MKTKTWQEEFDENFEETTITIETDSGWTTIPCSEKIKQFISDLISQTREETIRDIQDKEIEIQNILEPYFIVLDGRDNEPANEIIIEITKKILELLNKLKK